MAHFRPSSLQHFSLTFPSKLPKCIQQCCLENEQFRFKSTFGDRPIIDLPRYQHATTIHMVLDNLNTHFEKSLLETFGTEETTRIMKRIPFHYTPTYAA